MAELPIHEKNADFMDDILRESHGVFAGFIKSRKGPGKEYAVSIERLLLGKLAESKKYEDCFFRTASDDVGWLRSSEIEHALKKQIPHKTTLFRLLGDMVIAELVQQLNIYKPSSNSRGKSKKSNVYYRFLLHEPAVTHFQIMDREELLKSSILYYKAFRKYGELFLAAVEVFKSEGIVGPGRGIDETVLFLNNIIADRKKLEMEQSDDTNGSLFRLNLTRGLEQLITWRQYDPLFDIYLQEFDPLL